MALIANSETAAPANSLWLQAKIDSNEAAELTGGRFCIDRPLTFRNGTRVVGVNPIATVLQQIDPMQGAIEATDLLYASVENLTIEGPATGIGRGVYVAYKTQVGVGLVFRNLQVRQFGEDGIRIDRAISTVFDRVTCQNLGGYGFAALDGTSFEWRSTYALRCAKAGYLLNSLHYSSMAVAAVDSSAVGYMIRDCRGIVMVGCGSESMTGWALQIEKSEVTAINFRNLDNQGGMCSIAGNSTVMLLQPQEQGPAKQGVVSVQVEEGSTADIQYGKFLSPRRTIRKSA